MRVCFSGTFNILHKGHKYLIDKASEIAGKNGYVFIGITQGEMLKKKKFVTPLEDRIKAIKDYLKKKGYDKNTKITIIKDKYGPAKTGEYDAIIVSPETVGNAEEINKIRIKNDIKPLKVIKIKHVLAEDKKPISSTRIYNKEIDKEGNVLSKKQI